MKKYILLTCGLCLQITYNQVFGQQDSRIVAWVSAHPSVQIFSEINYNQLSSDFKAKLKGHVVVYKDQLTLNDLTAYEDFEKTDQVSQQIAIKEEDAQMIKNWRAFHPDVKIIRQSEFQALTEERRSMYQSHEALILIGEYLTVDDIANYPH